MDCDCDLQSAVNSSNEVKPKKTTSFVEQEGDEKWDDLGSTTAGSVTSKGTDFASVLKNKMQQQSKQQESQSIDEDPFGDFDDDFGSLVFDFDSIG